MFPRVHTSGSLVSKIFDVSSKTGSQLILNLTCAHMFQKNSKEFSHHQLELNEVFRAMTPL